ncbi:MAG: sulfotransferase [Pseudomonadota bacterium]
MSDDNRWQPDFILVGAMKCGTSTLAKQLDAQDGVFMAMPKEPNYFSDDAVYARGDAWYRSLFNPALEGDLKGEASTHYTKLPTYPQTVTRMARVLDRPRILYMIRNPMNRAVSHYIHEWSESRMSNRPEHAFATHSEIVDYGRYGMQIRPYIDSFGAENVMLTSLEQINRDADAAFARICEFLGMPQGAAWQYAIDAQNVSSRRVRKIPMQALLLDNPAAQALRRTLVPKGVRRWVRERRSMTTRPEIPASLKARMQDHFLQDREQLAELFPGHPALRLCYPFAVQ